jgi:hypothetical protein
MEVSCYADEYRCFAAHVGTAMYLEWKCRRVWSTAHISSIEGGRQGGGLDDRLDFLLRQPR